MQSTKSTSQKWPLPTNWNPYGRNRSDRQQPGAITLGKRGRLGRGAQVLPMAPAAEVIGAARPGTTFRNAHPRSVPGLVSRVSPVQTAMRNCTRDEGRSFEVGNQVLISSHRKLLSSKAMVVSVAEKSGQEPGRQG